MDSCNNVYSVVLCVCVNVLVCIVSNKFMTMTSSSYSCRMAGFPPFWHRKQLVMLRNIMDGKYEFVSPEWDDISDSAKDLVSSPVLYYTKSY